MWMDAFVAATGKMAVKGFDNASARIRSHIHICNNRSGFRSHGKRREIAKSDLKAAEGPKQLLSFTDKRWDLLLISLSKKTDGHMKMLIIS
jgi:hypothetical protein